MFEKTMEDYYNKKEGRTAKKTKKLKRRSDIEIALKEMFLPKGGTSKPADVGLGVGARPPATDETREELMEASGEGKHEAALERHLYPEERRKRLLTKVLKGVGAGAGYLGKKILEYGDLPVPGKKESKEEKEARATRDKHRGEIRRKKEEEENKRKAVLAAMFSSGSRSLPTISSGPAVQMGSFK